MYILQNEIDKNRYHTGMTSNISARLAAHNAGQCPHTTAGRPWKIIVIVKFLDEERACDSSRI